MIDLRSDTVTLPTEAMKRAMHDAELGDDVIDIDPTVQRLQSAIAERVGQEAAIFMPSGTMTNQVALRIHCRPGDEFLCEEQCHIYNFEQGAFAQLSNLVARTISTPDSQLTVEQVQARLRPTSEHMTRSRLLCLENTHNLGGGRVLPYDSTAELCRWAREQGLRLHLDGARLFNAVVASGVSSESWGELFDTVSVCFSKGLGAPVGSALCGPRDLIDKARWHRKLFGGAMRQSGVLAAAALHALDHHVEALATDHEAAQVLAAGVREIDTIQLEPEQVDTNIVIMKLDKSLGTAGDFVKKLHDAGVWMLPFTQQHIRAVTHRHVTPADTAKAVQIIQRLAGG